MNDKFLKSATDPHQYDSDNIDWEKEGDVDSPTRKYFQYYLLPKLNVDGMSVLDIGCGMGQLFPSLESKGAKEIVGIEPSSKSVAMARKHYPAHEVIETTLDSYKANRTFDAAISVMVFEHIKDIDLAFGKIKGILGPKGKFYLLVADKDYSIKPRFNYEMEVENLSDGVAITKVKRYWGVVYDILRPVQTYINAGMRAGFKDVDHVEIKPNEEILKFIPRYKDYLGVTTSHLLIFSK